MTRKPPKTLTPKLRFPEFRKAKNWEQKPLGELTDPITKRVGQSDCVPYTITSGEGLVSQEEKYGRTIAGKSLKNYYRLKIDDFAFNKSATKIFPQGYIARYQGAERAAVPNSIFTCFRIADSSVDPAYLDYLFQGNLHGRWLKDYITIGARAHGALNISDTDLYAMPVPLPKGGKIHAEQEKIAACLGSLDALIAAAGRKLAVMRDHKRGLMQQLFPPPGQSQPQLRFPEFRDAEGWKEQNLSRHIDLISGVHLSPSEYSDSGEVPYFTGPSDFTNSESGVSKWARQTANKGITDDILITVKGSGVGELLYLELPQVALGRQLMSVRPSNGVSRFYYQLMLSKRIIFEDLAKGNLIPGLSRGDLLGLKTPMPKPAEQRAIADCLSTLDTQFTAQAEQLEALKQHKRGLMQQLFPSSGDAEA